MFSYCYHLFDCRCLYEVISLVSYLLSVMRKLALLLSEVNGIVGKISEDYMLLEDKKMREVNILNEHVDMLNNFCSNFS